MMLVLAGTAFAASPLPPAAPESTGGSDLKAAHRALQRGRDQLQAGAFDAARASFAEAAALAPANSSLKHEAAEHAEFRLPIARAQRWLLNGQPALAERVLREALDANRADPDRVSQLNQALANLKALNDTEAQPLGIDNHAVVAVTRRAFEEFRAGAGHYPRTTTEVQRALAAHTATLGQFELAEFSGDGSAYLLVLKNRRDATHTITIQETGLLR